jgi:hypothetical protein
MGESISSREKEERIRIVEKDVILYKNIYHSNKMPETGYLYCISNQAIPEILKIGYTERDPLIRLSEANQQDTWKPPLPYVIEFARKVSECKEKEKVIHKLLEDKKIKNEFFRENKGKVKLMFELMDGEWWSNSNDCSPRTPRNTIITSCDGDTESNFSNSRTMRKRTKDYFYNGLKVRHIIGNDTLIGIYNGSLERIESEGHRFKDIHEFIHHHEDKTKTPRKTGKNNWKECSCEVGGQWILVDNLPLVS